ncbi:MAG: phosphoribosylamine---glycine ligase [Fimbriimonadaceae bacterium]|nr:phosphoribosylamine---glycine ligase [Fimbriimonadaceae bacterium]
MRILVIGSGGREHALAWKLAQEAEVHAAPGNPGIAEDCVVHDIPTTDFPALIGLAKGLAVDLVVIGPENPLIEGLADHLRAEGIPTFGPSAESAQLEGSKAFSKALMQAANVPTAEFQSFSDSARARAYARDMFKSGRRVVVKASGTALGKGVIVCDNSEQAERAIANMIDENEFGNAGSTIVVEERLQGREFSLLTLCSDDDFYSLPIAQDYKRAQDRDRGPNTGGMGSYSPVPWISGDLVKQAEEEIVRPILQSMRGCGYRGVLFSGLMVQDGRAYCLEYNVRFGDPETQAIMMRLGSGFADALLACAKGEPIPRPDVKDNAAVCVVVASANYPGPVEKGYVILPPEKIPEGSKLFHAGTAQKDGDLVTNGGRVFGATASGDTLEDARERAYELARAVRFQGAWFRSDIAHLRDAVPV